MAGMCSGVVGDTETMATVESASSRSAKRRRMEIHRFNVLSAELASNHPENDLKRQRLLEAKPLLTKTLNKPESDSVKEVVELELPSASSSRGIGHYELAPKFGFTSVRGRRKEMEDAVAVHPSFCRKDGQNTSDSHFFGVYDGHGCSHVAMKCKDLMHEIVKDELESHKAEEIQWKESFVRSFSQMDKEVTAWNTAAGLSSPKCRCELQTPRCDAVGSTAVVAVLTPEKIVVSNCGDSRAVLCRNGVAIPLSSDHKPDRADELSRIEGGGGRVIYWDGARVLGILAMSRAIGDNYLKPYVIPEPEITVTDRTAEDECLILASDGLWDVVSNETACGVARMCLRSKIPLPTPGGNVAAAGESSDKACLDASILLTKLALARQSTDNVSVVVIDLKKQSL